jgi:hypothetical protein
VCGGLAVDPLCDLGSPCVLGLGVGHSAQDGYRCRTDVDELVSLEEEKGSDGSKEADACQDTQRPAERIWRPIWPPFTRRMGVTRRKVLELILILDVVPQRVLGKQGGRGRLHRW